MNKIRNYKDLSFYVESREIVVEIYSITYKYPKHEQGFTGVVNQIRRASVSISCNIAEGSSRGEREYYHFLTLSLGSLREVETLLGISRDLEYISEEKYSEINNKVDFCTMKICQYIKALSKSTFKKR